MAGVVITLAIVYVLAGTVRQLFNRMMDAVDPHVVTEITETAQQVDGVLAVHDVSARWVGRELVGVMHVDCDPNSSLKDAHDVAVRVEHEAGHELPLARLDVHMDPGRDDHQHAGGGPAHQH